jgi:hypothetical protein
MPKRRALAQKVKPALQNLGKLAFDSAAQAVEFALTPKGLCMVQTLYSRRRAHSLAGAFSLSLIATLPAFAEDNPALTRLKSMSDYIDAQTSIQASFDSSIEVMTTDQQKIQFNSSGEVMLERPGHLHLRRTGGFADAEFFFDGTTATLSDATDHRYASFPAPATIEELHNLMLAQSGTSLPGADLLAKGGFERLSADITDAKLIGPAVIGGVTCDHLAFRTAEVDWQLWVQSGDAPAPCKMVITSKTVAGAPQYSVQITGFQTGVTFPDGSFTFTPAADAAQVSLSALGDIDEIPPENGK